MGKWLDVIITGSPCPDFEEAMDSLAASHGALDTLQIYEVGAPDDGVNPQVTEWAFKHCHPLVLGLPEDIGAILRRFAHAEDKAVVAFSDGSAIQEEKAETARTIAAVSGAQYHKVPKR